MTDNAPKAFVDFWKSKANFDPNCYPANLDELSELYAAALRASGLEQQRQVGEQNAVHAMEQNEQLQARVTAAESALRAIVEADREHRNCSYCRHAEIGLAKLHLHEMFVAIAEAAKLLGPKPVKCAKCGDTGRQWDNGDKIQCDCVTAKLLEGK